RGDVLDHVDHRVVRRVGLGAAAGEVDDVHSVSNGRLECRSDLRRVRDEGDRRGDVEDAIVAAEGAGCDTREATRGRMVTPSGRAGTSVAGNDAGDMCCV